MSLRIEVSVQEWQKRRLTLLRFGIRIHLPQAGNKGSLHFSEALVSLTSSTVLGKSITHMESLCMRFRGSEVTQGEICRKECP